MTRFLFFLFLKIVLATSVKPDIIGGKIVTDPAYKFTASLQKKGNDNVFKHFCGGSLIDENYILTAGHCVRSGPPDRIQLNSFKINDNQAKFFSVSKVIIHPDYNGNINDIAILKLNKPCKNCTIINLNEYSVIFPEAIVVGWGYTKEGSGQSVEDLREVTLPIVSNKICSKSYPGIDESNICAGFEKGKFDSCSGDSGGPLFFKNGNCITQIGIVSYGRGCARPKYYGVYTNVSYYKNFIKKSLTECIRYKKSDCRKNNFCRWKKNKCKNKN